MRHSASMSLIIQLVSGTVCIFWRSFVKLTQGEIDNILLDTIGYISAICFGWKSKLSVGWHAVSVTSNEVNTIGCKLQIGVGWRLSQSPIRYYHISRGMASRVYSFCLKYNDAHFRRMLQISKIKDVRKYYNIRDRLSPAWMKSVLAFQLSPVEYGYICKAKQSIPCAGVLPKKNACFMVLLSVYFYFFIGSRYRLTEALFFGIRFRTM